MNDVDDLTALRQELAGLEERPVAQHADVLEDVHARLTGELERLVIPRAERREGDAAARD